MEEPVPAKKKSLGKIIAIILLWAFALLVALAVFGYYVPDIAHWGFSGSIQIMEGRLNRLQLPADKMAELRADVAALKQYVETVRMGPEDIVLYSPASDAVEKVLKTGRADDADMQAIRQAFAAAEITVEAAPAPRPAAPAPGPAEKKK
jgi:hypothetical protein